MRQERRCIPKNPKSIMWYLIDSCFLVNRYLDESRTNEKGEIDSITAAKQYWNIIDQQLEKGKCRILILDVCIAEAFKVLAKKRYQQSTLIKSAADYNKICGKLSKDLRISAKEVKQKVRIVRYHDIQTCRDIVVA